jgi:hypothetical protein
MFRSDIETTRKQIYYYRDTVFLCFLVFFSSVVLSTRSSGDFSEMRCMILLLQICLCSLFLFEVLVFVTKS